MRLNVVSFTNQGSELVNRIKTNSRDMEIVIRQADVSLEGWIKDCFEKKEAILFIGALGIAVRIISPFIQNKLLDPPVLVMDVLGQFVIPVLSGHVGGANDLAYMLADVIGAVPVITTATDINNAWAVDSWATNKHLSIVNKDAIKRVSSKVLNHKPVIIAVQNQQNEKDKEIDVYKQVDVIISDCFSETDLRGNALLLKPQKYVIGIGCKRGKSYEDIRALLDSCIKKLGIDTDDIYCISTIDVKKDEEGIKELSSRLSIPVLAFSSELLKLVPGEFGSSAFVEEKVGVGNVCERAAMLAAGEGATLILDKQSKDGVTIAIAKR